MNHINSERDLKTYLIAAIATCIIVTIYEYTQMGTGERLSLPFESPIGTNPEEASIEPATLGGYYLLVLGVAFGFISEYSWRATFPLWGLIVFIITPFVLTLSRTSYVGLIILLISYIFLARSKRFVYTIFTAMVFLSFLWYSKDIKEKVTERVMYTVNLIERDSFTLKIGNREVTFEPSTAQRIRNYIEIATYRFPKHPFFGWGATGVGLVDAQFPRVLGEAGAVGFTIFLMLIVTIFREAYRVYHTVDKPLARALSLGLVFVFIGIIFQSVGANTFIIVRIMEPFWLLVACVMSLPYIYKKEEIQSA